MSIFEKQRWKIFNSTQHPLKHEISDLSYANPRLPGISLLGDALDAVVASIYPNYKATVATKANLPVSASLNDYYIVNDDGDGKAAGYVWSVIDNTGQWIKRYDMDWSMDAILAEAVNRTQPMYVAKYGSDDRDPNGAVVTGTFAGQRVYGGQSPNTNLTLSANAGDTGGAHTGYVQVDDSLRPAQDAVYDLGTLTNQWANVFAEAVKIGTLTIEPGSITDSSGEVDFGSNDIVTTGIVTAANISAGGIGLGSLAISGDQITSSTAQVSFADENIVTTGAISGGSLSIDSSLVLDTGSITSATGAISFGDENLTTTGNLTASQVSGSTVSAGNLQISGNTISATNTNGGITLTPIGSGTVSTSATVNTGHISATGNISASGTISNGALELNGNTIRCTTPSGVVALQPSGSATVVSYAAIVPTGGAHNLGRLTDPWGSLFISGGITDGTNTITKDTLLSLRSVTSGAAIGHSLFWDGSKWVSSKPDTEIAHNDVSGLTTGDAGHTQFVMLGGRAGGQTVQGGIAASQSLTLESTAHETKGSVYTADSLKPLVNATYSGTWAGTDLGDNSHYFRDVYVKGEARGLRVENSTSTALPSASAANKGRMVFATDNNELYVDTGGSWSSLSSMASGGSKYSEDVAFNGSETQKDVDVSASIADARFALWQLKDNANSYEVMHVQIKATSATNIRINTNVALPAGSYRLVGLE